MVLARRSIVSHGSLANMDPVRRARLTPKEWTTATTPNSIKMGLMRAKLICCCSDRASSFSSAFWFARSTIARSLSEELERGPRLDIRARDNMSVSPSMEDRADTDDTDDNELGMILQSNAEEARSTHRV